MHVPTIFRTMHLERFALECIAWGRSATSDCSSRNSNTSNCKTDVCKGNGKNRDWETYFDFNILNFITSTSSQSSVQISNQEMHKYVRAMTRGVGLVTQGIKDEGT